MEELIPIGNHEVLLKIYNEQRVVTFRDIDMVHERPEGTARKAFWRNKNHFKEGEDYFVLDVDEAKTAFGIAAPEWISTYYGAGILNVGETIW